MIKILIIAMILSTSVFAQEKKEFDFYSKDLVMAAMECHAEFTAAIAKINGAYPGLKSATLVEGGKHEYDQTFTLKIGYIEPMLGIVETEKLVVERLFVNGNYQTTCTATEIK